MNFDIMYTRVVGHEGKWTTNPKDPGNWTGGKVGVGELKGSKYGLSAASYPDLDIEHLTDDDAIKLYHEWYVKGKLDRFIGSMQYQLFDAAFNHGFKRANKILQQALGFKGSDVDGIIGPKTLAASQTSNMSENDQLMRFCSYRITFFTGLSHFDEFGKGWMNRVAQNLLYAAQDNIDIIPATSNIVSSGSYTPQNSDEELADVVMDFANVFRGGFIGNFIEQPLVTVYDIHQTARTYVKDHFNLDVPPWNDQDAERIKNITIGSNTWSY